MPFAVQTNNTFTGCGFSTRATSTRCRMLTWPSYRKTLALPDAGEAVLAPPSAGTGSRLSRRPRSPRSGAANADGGKPQAPEVLLREPMAASSLRLGKNRRRRDALDDRCWSWAGCQP